MAGTHCLLLLGNSRSDLKRYETFLVTLVPIYRNSLPSTDDLYACAHVLQSDAPWATVAYQQAHCVW
ncbi:hypothetical protein EV356DRAFT_500883 [Viridothelium virens]|uniref:Uncharacterized protein n=1 Tax=Viridothelium virens TaxID=1048519 RepID=A0A6A6HA09_VIRVR|nr:hypothetical protein EV356DRAFT_500883 [Viridothelium virens]